MADIVHISQEVANNNDWIYGATGTDQSMSQTFAPTADIVCPSVELRVGKAGTSPTDDLIVRIETTTAGKPSGTLVDANATITVSNTLLAAVVDWYLFTFPAAFNLTNGTLYAIVANRSGTRSTTNAYAWNINTAGGYAGGAYYQNDSGTWNNGSEGGDATFKVYLRETTVVKDMLGGIIPFPR